MYHNHTLIEQPQHKCPMDQRSAPWASQVAVYSPWALGKRQRLRSKQSSHIINAHTHTHTHTHTYKHTPQCRGESLKPAHARTHPCTHTHTHTHHTQFTNTHTCTHTHVHTLLHTHTLTLSLSLSLSLTHTHTHWGSPNNCVPRRLCPVCQVHPQN